MACGCNEVCTCFDQSSETVATTGDGSVGNPYLHHVIVDPIGGLQTGVNGVGLLIDPASTLPWSLGPDGLLLECCPAEVMDSETINFDVTGGAVTGDVIPDPAGGLENTPNGVAIKVDPSSTADVTLGVNGLKVDVTPASVLDSAWEPGDLKWTASAVTTAGWLDADGSLQLIASFPDLFAAIGHEYNGGVDPGGGQFRLPDGQGRSIVGLGTHADVNSRQDNDGLALAARTPRHTHTGPSHQHGPGTLTVAAAGATTSQSATTTGNENTAQSGLAAGMTVLEVENCLRDAINADADCSGATPVQLTVAAGGGIVSGVADPGNHHQHDYTHGHNVSVAGTVNGGLTGAAGTGATGSAHGGYLVGRLLIKT